MSAAGALGRAFSGIPDKNTAWSDLHRLTQDENSNMLWMVAYALGRAFSDIPDKDIAWSDLHQLTQDENSDMQIHAYYSLGSASVYKATETEDENKFKDELKKAIYYFEKSSQEAADNFYNPGKFCLPFYRSYYAVISRQQEAEAEATKYLDEAKNAAGETRLANQRAGKYSLKPWKILQMRLKRHRNHLTLARRKNISGHAGSTVTIRQSLRTVQGGNLRWLLRQ